MAKFMRELKQNKKGIVAGALMGALVVFYMKTQGAITQALDPGLIDQILPSMPAIDVAFIKLLLTASLIGAFIGYVIQDKVIKK